MGTETVHQLSIQEKEFWSYFVSNCRRPPQKTPPDSDEFFPLYSKLNTFDFIFGPMARNLDKTNKEAFWKDVDFYSYHQRVVDQLAVNQAGFEYFLSKLSFVCLLPTDVPPTNYKLNKRNAYKLNNGENRMRKELVKNLTEKINIKNKILQIKLYLPGSTDSSHHRTANAE